MALIPRLAGAPAARRLRACRRGFCAPWRSCFALLALPFAVLSRLPGRLVFEQRQDLARPDELRLGLLKVLFATAVSRPRQPGGGRRSRSKSHSNSATTRCIQTPKRGRSDAKELLRHRFGSLKSNASARLSQSGASRSSRISASNLVCQSWSLRSCRSCYSWRRGSRRVVARCRLSRRRIGIGTRSRSSRAD